MTEKKHYRLKAEAAHVSVGGVEPSDPIDPALAGALPMSTARKDGTPLLLALSLNRYVSRGLDQSEGPRTPWIVGRWSLRDSRWVSDAVDCWSTEIDTMIEPTDIEPIGWHPLPGS